MRRSLLALTLLLLLCVPAFGLSDAEYRRLKRTSSDFRQADIELSQVWNSLKGSLSSKAFSELQKDQREWIRKGRDDAAKKYIKEGYSRAEAYAKATYDRAEVLRAKGKSTASQPARPKRPVRKTQPKPEPEPEPEPEQTESGFPLDEDDDDHKGEIEENRFKNTEPGNPEGNYSKKGGFMTVVITDKSSMEASVTISLDTENEEAVWTSESWIDGDTLVLYDKNYSDCEVTLTFQGNKVKVEASETESWNEILGEGLTLSGTYTRN